MVHETETESTDEFEIRFSNGQSCIAKDEEEARIKTGNKSTLFSMVKVITQTKNK